jgi:hypothetical protein
MIPCATAVGSCQSGSESAIVTFVEAITWLKVNSETLR